MIKKYITCLLLVFSFNLHGDQTHFESFEEEYGLAFRPFDLIDEEANLYELLVKVDPSLRDISDPIEITQKLLPIICDITPKSINRKQMCNISSSDKSAQEYYTQVVRKYKTPACGGHSGFFAKVLRDYFNIPAFVMDQGVRGTYKTHVVTFVPVLQQIGNISEYKFYLFDPHYGCYYKDLQGKVMDLESIFNNQPLRVHFIKFDVKFVVDHTVKQLPKRDPLFEKQLEDGRTVYSYLNLKHPHVSGFAHSNCRWQETLPLRWLYMDKEGGILSGPSPRDKIGSDFYKLIKEKQIHIFSK